jgi:hypothetical protein
MTSHRIATSSTLMSHLRPTTAIHDSSFVSLTGRRRYGVRSRSGPGGGLARRS